MANDIQIENDDVVWEGFVIKVNSIKTCIRIERLRMIHGSTDEMTKMVRSARKETQSLKSDLWEHCVNNDVPSSLHGRIKTLYENACNVSKIFSTGVAAAKKGQSLTREAWQISDDCAKILIDGKDFEK